MYHKNKIINNYLYVLKLIWNYDRVFFIFNLIQSFINGVTPLINLYFPKLIIDVFTTNKNYINIITIIVIWMIFDVIILIFNRYFTKTLSIRHDFLSNYFVFSVYKKMVNLDMNLLENPDIYDMKQKAIDVSRKNIGRNTCIQIFNFLTNLIGIISTFLILSSVNAYIFWILTVIILANICIVIIQKKSNYNFWNRITPLNKKLNYYFQLLSDPVHSKEMKMYSLASWVINKYNEVKKEFFNASNNLYNKLVLLNFLKGLIDSSQKAVIYLFLAFQVLYKNMSLGNFTLFFGALNKFSGYITSMVNIVATTIENTVYIQAYKEFLEIKNNIAVEEFEISDTIKRKEPFVINFKDVSFKYPGQSEYTIKNFNLNLEKGKFYVVVGENGAGKTTFINLLCRLYDAQEGQIIYNDIDIKDIGYKEYRDLYGVVFQDYKYYAFTIAENIALESYDKGTAEYDEINECLIAAGLYDKVNSLKHGLDTHLKKIFDEDGVELSGGETQKLALAKSLYKGAEIFILDEPSSALDPLAEENLINTFINLPDDKTVIYISHRLSIAHYADEVIMIKDGKVLNKGSHQYMLNECEEYSKMYNKQASHYK